MNCHIVFYMAKKTSLCEKTLKKVLSDMNINPLKTLFAINPPQLGEHLITSLSKCNLVFTVGGLFSSDDMGIEKVLSRALSHNKPDDIKKLKNNLSEYDGYLIRKDCQLIIALPDEPNEITEIFSENLKKYLSEFSSI